MKSNVKESSLYEFESIKLIKINNMHGEFQRNSKSDGRNEQVVQKSNFPEKKM